MIGMLHGTVASRTLEGVIIDTGGIGWLVRVPLRSLEALPAIGGTARLFVSTQVREDAIVLYGFVHDADRRLFEKLIGVSGIGPRIGLSILSELAANEVQRAILANDVKTLTRIPGIGTRTAQRLIVELADSVAKLNLGGIDAPTPGTPSALLDDLQLALLDLGYNRKQASDVATALRAKADEGVPLERLLKDALALLRNPTQSRSEA